MSSETSVDFSGLLPEPGTVVRCTDWTNGLEVDPVGTAICADQVLLVEVPLPWPKPVGDHEWLRTVMPIAGQGGIATKLLASVPRGYTPGVRVTSYLRAGGGAHRAVYEIPNVNDLEAVVASLVALPGAAPPPEPLAESEPPEHAVLVCTQGSHDVCCGSHGTRFALEVEQAFPEVEVHRVSHTGGHRFAPTAMTLPDGRMWAWLSVEQLRLVLDRSADVTALQGHGRGWWGAPKGFAQAAEESVFHQRGWEWAAQPRTVSTDPVGTEAARCVVESAGQRHEMMVEIARHIPTISCRAPGGLPAKPGREFVSRQTE